MGGYYPFGMNMNGPWMNDLSGNDNPYQYNGKELESFGGLGWYDYGARYYDPAIGRWTSVDPLAEKYASVSPYVYALNTPINAYDPDGRLVIFVNGFRKAAYTDYLLNSPSPGYSTAPWNHSNKFFRNDEFNYWGGNNGFSGRISNGLRDYNQLYVDGMFSPHSTGSERYDRGYSDGKLLAQKIKDGKLNLNGETIKLVGHSHGGAHASGMAAALIDAGLPVEYLLLFAPHQPGQFSAPCGLSCGAYQFSRTGDHVSSDQSQLGVGQLFVGDSRFANVSGATLFSLKNGNDDGLGNHSIETYNSAEDFKKAHPDLYRQIFGNQ